MERCRGQDEAPAGQTSQQRMPLRLLCRDAAHFACALSPRSASATRCRPRMACADGTSPRYRSAKRGPSKPAESARLFLRPSCGRPPGNTLSRMANTQPRGRRRDSLPQGASPHGARRRSAAQPAQMASLRSELTYPRRLPLALAWAGTHMGAGTRNESADCRSASDDCRSVRAGYRSLTGGCRIAGRHVPGILRCRCGPSASGCCYATWPGLAGTSAASCRYAAS